MVVAHEFDEIVRYTGVGSRKGFPHSSRSSKTSWRSRTTLLAAALYVTLAPVTEAEVPVSSGSGFLVNKAGWVLTNAHVIDDCDRVEVAGLGSVTRVVRHQTEDLAALRVTPAPNVRPLVFRARPVRLAEQVHALGYPLSTILSGSVRVTSGSVNALTGVDGRENLL